MFRTHFQSFLFAAVLLASVFVTRPRAELAPVRTPGEAIQRTSVAAPRLPIAAALEPLRVPRTTPTPTPPTAPEVSAAVILVQDLGSGAVLLERAALQRWPIASLTKLMSAHVIAEAWAADRAVTITSEAIVAEGNAGEFAPGETFAARDLISAMLVASSNDAAEALAHAYGRQALIDAMQVQAAELGMSDTSFFDPTGLSVLNQSTARDLALLASHLAASHPDLFAMTAAPAASIRELGSGRERVLRNTIRFAGKPEFRGGKTGFTDESGGNLLSLVAANGRTLLIIVLGSEDRFGDTEKLYGALAGS